MGIDSVVMPDGFGRRRAIGAIISAGVFSVAGTAAIASVPTATASLTVDVGDEENVVAHVESEDGTVEYAEMWISPSIAIRWSDLPEPPATIYAEICEVGVETVPSPGGHEMGPYGCAGYHLRQAPPMWIEEEDDEWARSGSFSPHDMPDSWLTISEETLDEMVVSDPQTTELFGIDLEISISMLAHDDSVMISDTESTTAYIRVTNASTPELSADVPVGGMSR